MIAARESAASTHWGTALNSAPEHRKSIDENYNRNGSARNSDDLSVILPDVSPTFDAPATVALLRLLLTVRDNRRTSNNVRQMESE